MKKKPLFYYGAPEVKTIQNRPDINWKPIKFTRVWGMPNAQTFKIGPISKLLKRYVSDPSKWVDPFCGKNSPAAHKNDHNPEIKESNGYHYEALEFAKITKSWGGFYGILFDLPYSFRQISEHYKSVGQKANKLHTSMAFYERVKSAFCEQILPGGFAISFGWNTNGFGRARGFEIIEIMCVAHGGSKNDTIVVVEQKL